MSKVNLECIYPYEMGSMEDMKKAQEWIGKIVQSTGLEDDLVSFRFDVMDSGKETEANSLEVLKETTEGKQVLFESVYCFVRKHTSEPAHTRIMLFRGNEGIRCRISTEYSEAVERIQADVQNNG